MCEPWEELFSKVHFVFTHNQHISHRIDLGKVVALIISYGYAVTKYSSLLQRSERVIKLCKQFPAYMDDHLPPSPSSTPQILFP